MEKGSCLCDLGCGVGLARVVRVQQMVSFGFGCRARGVLQRFLLKVHFWDWNVCWMGSLVVPLLGRLLHTLEGVVVLRRTDGLLAVVLLNICGWCRLLLRGLRATGLHIK